MQRLITDFDGPIMDVSERYYRVYQFCLDQLRDPDQSVHQLTKAEFWQLKRSQVPEREIGRMSGLDETQALEFARLRRHTIHTSPYLVYDLPHPNTIATLERVRQAGLDLILLTMRRVNELDDAMIRCDLARFFPVDRRYCLSHDALKHTDVEDKTRLMEQVLAELPPATANWMVGDTEADILAAKAHGIPTIAVLSGIRNRDRLLRHHPDWIVNNLSDAVDLILQSSSKLPIRCGGREPDSRES
jgi:phosphoglycolate phosphatase-like HAD superfamily hydrolase